MNPSVKCFRKFPVAKQFMDKRVGEENQDFPSKIFCLTLPKIFVREPFGVSLVLGTEKVWIRGGTIKFFRRKFFVSQCRNFP